jgi:hypothetical protein
VCDVGGLIGVDQQAGAAEHVGQRSPRRGDDRPADRHRLEHRHPEARRRTPDEQARPFMQRAAIIRVDVADTDEAFSGGRLIRSSHEAASSIARPARTSSRTRGPLLGSSGFRSLVPVVSGFGVVLVCAALAGPVISCSCASAGPHVLARFQRAEEQDVPSSGVPAVESRPARLADRSPGDRAARRAALDPAV